MSESLKEVWAIIRRDKIKKTKEMMDSIGVGAMSIHPVSGRGKQAGFVQSDTEALDMGADYSTSAPRLVPTDPGLAAEGATLTRPVTYVPKKIISMVVPAAVLKDVIDGIISVNQTGNKGDGKIFVMPVEEAFRIRTSEHGLEAVDY
jgi:nitrogen regulatory protein PII 2